MRGVALLVALACLEVGVPRLVGPVAEQVRVVGRLGDPTLEPAGAFLVLLAAATELVAAYLAVVVCLRMLAWLPGTLGRLAAGGIRMLTVPAVRQAVDGLLGGVLVVQLGLSPVVVHADPEGTRAGPRPVAAATAPTTPVPPWLSWPMRPSGGAGPGATAGGGAIPPSTASPAPVAPPSLPPAATRALPPVAVPGQRGRDGSVAPGPRGAGTSAPAAGPGRVRPGPPYTIRPGDTLWGIAAARLSPGSRSPASTDRYWRRIYRANRATVGADPDLIHPGARLVVPPYRSQTAEPGDRPPRPAGS